MLSKLDRIRQRVKEEKKSTVATEFYFLAKELGCLPDLLGREYDVVYEGDKIVKIIQQPIPIPTFITLLDEMEQDYKNQQKQMKKGRKK